MAQQRIEVIGGVDTHRDTHTAAALDGRGRLLGSATFPATAAGYRALWRWLCAHGRPVRVGVEGTGAYGAGLVRALAAEDVTVVEVDRPDRRTRRRRGKSDPVDAEAAARAALAASRPVVPKQRDGQVEALRVLRVARRSAVAARADVLRQMHTLVVTAPEPLRATLRELPARRLVTTCAATRPARTHTGDPTVATRTALRCLARRHQHLSAEINNLDTLITPLVTAAAPALLALPGIGIDVAGQLLVTTGENPHRLRSEAAFAMLVGAAPLPASSGHTTRHRLNRGGDRQANAALHRVTLNRLRWDPRTRAYAQRRTTEGLTKRDIIRCLKRYLAREIYNTLCPPLDHP